MSRTLAKVFAVGAVLLAHGSPALAQDNTIAGQADRYLSARSEMGNFSGAVLIARGDSVLFRKAYGFADVEKRIPYTPETQHYIASVSKMFTALAALKLRNEGKLDLGASICRYLDDCPDTWKPVTVDHLIHHTSGIPDYESELELASEKYLEYMRQPKSSERIVVSARTKPLEFAPGEKFNYSNTGYIILSYVVQKAAGIPFAQFVKNRLLAPAGMTQSGVIGADSARNLAAGYTYGNLGWEKTLGGVRFTDGHMRRYPTFTHTPPAGDGFMFSTLDDLFRWSRLMDGSTLIPRNEVAEILTPGKGRYGFGWFVDSAFQRKRLRHTGSFPGYVSDYIKFPDDSVTIIVFSNLDRGRVSSVQRDLSAITFGQSWDMPVRGKVIALTPPQLQSLTGTYRLADGRDLIIKIDDMLVAELKGQYTAGLIPLSTTEFYMPLGDGRAIFKMGSSGRATEVNMRYGGADRIAKRVD
jgi:CubicO group peptidase (beta-lactamase class C family)